MPRRLRRERQSARHERLTREHREGRKRRAGPQVPLIETRPPARPADRARDALVQTADREALRSLIVIDDPPEAQDARGHFAFLRLFFVALERFALRGFTVPSGTLHAKHTTSDGDSSLPYEFSAPQLAHSVTTEEEARAEDMTRG